MTTSTRTIQYRRLNRNEWSFANTLQEAIETSLDMDGVKTKIGVAVQERLVDLDQDRKSTILNGYQAPRVKSGANFFAGQIVLYRPGIDLPAIEEDLENLKTTFQVRQYQSNEKMKPIEGVLHFVSFQDHIGLIESSAVRSRWLERYLTWMLKDATDVIDQESIVILDAQFTSSSGVKPPKQATHLSIPTRPTRLGAEKPSVKKSTIVRGERAGASVEQILELLGWRKPDIEQLLSSLPEGTDLYGELAVFAKKGSKNVNFNTIALETAFRNVPDDDLNLTTKSGNQKGSMFKLSERQKISTTGALLDPEDATDQIWSQMMKWAQEGRIDLKI